jgi:predicted ribosome quality control (RQC) complex YloA/Tae2 family protein
MALYRSDLVLVLAEITPALRGGWIQKIYQPRPRTIIFDIRSLGQTHRLLICCELDGARLHLTTRPHQNPPTPPPFCQYLRAHFQGARLNEIHQISNDRIVELQMTGKEGTHTIVCELTGHKADMLVLDTERRVLRDLANKRDLIGQPYVPSVRTVAEGFEGKPARFPGVAGSPFPVSTAIEAFYETQETAVAVDHAKMDRVRSLRKTLKKEQRLIEAWRGDLAKALVYKDYSRYGELLKANLGEITKGLDRITVTDYFDEHFPEVTIPLDPTKSPHSNMDEYFRKQRKYLAAERELQPRIERAEQEIRTLQQELQEIAQGTWAPPTTRPQHEPAKTRARPVAGGEISKGSYRHGPFRRFTSSDGLPIFVGRNARENDELTFGLAKSEDLWLHARGTPGSHVVVRLAKGSDPPPETLRDAATLALLYSDLKKSGKGEVIYTRRKWVKKAKGQAPGAVIVTQEKSLHISLDKTRLEALKNRRNQE